MTPQRFKSILKFLLFGIVLLGLVFFYNLSKTELVTKGTSQCRCFGLSAIAGDSPYPDSCIGATYYCRLQPTPTSTPVPSFDTSWETYTDNKLGFSFRYPESFGAYWKFKHKDAILYLCSSGEICDTSLTIYSRLNPDQLDLKEWFLKEVGLSTYEDSAGNLKQEKLEEKETRVGDLTIFTHEQISAEGIFEAQAYVPLKSSRDILELTISQDTRNSAKEIEIYTQAKQLRDQILSTFKFVN